MQAAVLAALLRGPTKPLLGLDFTRGQYAKQGQRFSTPSDIPGWSFTRASVGTALDAAGNIISFVSGQPRITNLGLLIEEARTNSFLNSAIGVTQLVTTTAASWTLSFYGTGSIVLTGGATGTLSGTGANNRVSLSVTALAVPTTLTVSGSVTNVQFEAGAFATSYIPTAGAAVTRARDEALIAGLASPLAFTLFAEFLTNQLPPVPAFVASFDDGTSGNRVQLSTTTVAQLGAGSTAAGVSQFFSLWNVPVTGTPVARTRVAFRASLNDVAVYANGSSLFTSSTFAVAVSNQLHLGTDFAKNQQLNGYLRSAQLYAAPLGNPQLASLTGL